MPGISSRALAIALFLSAGCMGSIGDDMSRRDEGAAGEAKSAVPGQSGAGPAIVPGRVTLHRLNRTEYNNTVRDLLGTTQRPGDDLPAEDLSFGFDNIADALNVSALHVETYASASESLIEEAAAPSAPMRSQILSCDVGAGATPCARQIIKSFARRAWRRPPSEAQIDRLARFMDVAAQQGDPPLAGIKLALQAILASPRFLFRVELNPDPVPEVPWPIDDFELASRLSYFLWSSMPDEALLQRAESGGLREEGALRAEVKRMLGDPRAQELINNLAGQWLYVRAIPRHQPDLAIFSHYDGALGDSMASSMNLFFRELLEQALPVDQLVTADWTEVDARLAAHYGLPSPGDGFHRVPAPVGRRAGILGQAGLLMVTSEPGRTSPVKRGAWVLGNLVCSPPPPPPPGVTALDKQTGAAAMGTIRQRLERHRADARCAACHRAMDPIGFGLENFDAVGQWRTTDGGETLDSKGTLPDGSSFENAEQLGQLIAKDERFPRCVAEKLAVYALGRGVDAEEEKPFLDAVTSDALRGTRSLAAFTEAIVASIPFRMRSPEPKGAP